MILVNVTILTQDDCLFQALQQHLGRLKQCSWMSWNGSSLSHKAAALEHDMYIRHKGSCWQCCGRMRRWQRSPRPGPHGACTAALMKHDVGSFAEPGLNLGWAHAQVALRQQRPAGPAPPGFERQNAGSPDAPVPPPGFEGKAALQSLPQLPARHQWLRPGFRPPRCKPGAFPFSSIRHPLPSCTGQLPPALSSTVLWQSGLRTLKEAFTAFACSLMPMLQHVLIGLQEPRGAADVRPADLRSLLSRRREGSSPQLSQ